MSIQAIAWAIDQRVGSATGKLLLMCIANYADERGECFPSQKTLSGEAELSERSIRDWLDTLEIEGFLTRRRRHRSDGSRTTDLICLCLDRGHSAREGNLSAKSAGSQNQPANDAKPTGKARRSYRRQVPGNEPAKDPSENPAMGEGGLDSAKFADIWEKWPPEERPKQRSYAESVFRRLAPSERAQAVEFAGRYRTLELRRSGFATMITYLKERRFLEFIGAPETDHDGDFIITPDRPEWPVWMVHFNESLGESAVLSAEKRGRILTKTRWPDPSIDDAFGLDNA